MDIETNMKMYSMELSVSQLATAIMSLTLPGIILKHAVISSLTHSNIIVRHEAVLTLTTMFEQIRKYLLIAKEYYESDIHFCTFENNVLQSTIKVYVYYFYIHIYNTRE